MNQRRIRIGALLLALMLLFPFSSTHAFDAVDAEAEAAAALSAVKSKPGKLLSLGKDFPAGTSLADWSAMALALSGSEEAFSSYLSDLKRYVEKAYAEEGGLHPVQSTPYHRIALTVLALGGDPTAFGTAPDGTPIDLIADGTYAFRGGSIGDQGLNGWIYALIALDASGAQVPADARFTREDMLSAITAAQLPDGGFNLIFGSGDVDMTAMALQALAPYRNACPDVIEAALRFLSNAMSDRCMFAPYGAPSVESAAETVTALCALGINPETDSRFCRGGESLLSGIARFKKEDGTYSHLLTDETGDCLATAKVLLSFTAVRKLKHGDGSIFDFSGYAGPSERPESNFPLIIGGTAATAAVITAIRFTATRRKHGKDHR